MGFANSFKKIVLDKMISDRKGKDKKSYRICNFFKNEKNAFSSEVMKMMENSIPFAIFSKKSNSPSLKLK